MLEVEQLNALADHGGLEELKMVQVADQLVVRLGKSRDEQHTLFAMRGGKCDLCGEDGLATAGKTGDQQQRTLNNTTAQDQIQLRHACSQKG